MGLCLHHLVLRAPHRGSDSGLAAGVGSLARSDSSWSLESREELAIDSADRLRERALSLPSPSMLATEQSV